MRIKGNSTATLETMVKWAIKNEATSIFVACINKIHKHSVDRGINPVVVLAVAAFDSKFGKFDIMCNESHCNLFYKLKEVDDNISVKRYKSWSDGIKEFLDELEEEMCLKNITEIEDIVPISENKNIILGFATDIVNTHIEPSTIRIQPNDDNMKDVFIMHDDELKKLNSTIMDLQDKLQEKDVTIHDLQKSNEDMKEEIKLTNNFKDNLKDFLK